ncbi:MAG: pyruvate dehydrogenase (acetyl-transferring) E1 component subunit alpha [Candidatus Aenigmatarchaeota archaeon]
MPIKTVANFDIKYLQILDENGNVDEKLFEELKLSNEKIKEMYFYMLLARTFDNKAFSLQRQGRLLTYAPLLGQEACQVGVALAIEKNDWIFPSFRENGAAIVHGMPIEMLFQYWSGDERGHRIPENVHWFPVCIPVSTHIPHAVGFAWGLKLKKSRDIVLCFFGDGATSKGDFYEALNFAGVFKVPLVAIIQNNQYAISVPRRRQSAAQTLAQKAIAFGFEGLQVDGNDIFAVYKSVKDAAEKARKGFGPSLIECYTYRMSHHTTADDWTKYRDKKEVEEWKKKDPIDRLKKFMIKRQIADEKFFSEQEKKVQGIIEKAVEKMESFEPPKYSEIFSYTYVEMPQRLKEELEEAQKLFGGK